MLLFSGLIEQLSEEQLTFIDTLEPLNIEARYPTYKEQIIALLNADYCNNLLEGTKQFQLWIKKKLSE